MLDVVSVYRFLRLDYARGVNTDGCSARCKLVDKRGWRYTNAVDIYFNTSKYILLW